MLNEVVVKKHKGDRIGLFTLSPDPTLHGTTHYGKVLKFVDTTIINFNGYRETKNILPSNKMLGAMRYFKQLYGHKFTKEELTKIEQSFYKGVMRRTAYRGYYYESEKL